jgi:Tol biopolymer transport system component
MKKLLLITLLAFLAIGRAQDRAEIQLQAAIKKEVFDGDIKAAIEQYKKIIASGSASRAVKAKALLQLGGCYEKQGSAEARNKYEQLVKEYKDQIGIVAQAQARLSALGVSGPKADFLIRQIWIDPDGFDWKPSPDGRYLAFQYAEFNQFGIRDLVTGTSRKIALKAPQSEGADGTATAFTWSPDGTRIAYQWVNKVGSSDLRVIDLKSSNQRVVYSNKDARPTPCRWSPDGKSILTSLKSKDQKPELVRISVDQDSIQQVRFLDASWSSFSISPDARHIAYLSALDSNKASDLWIVPLMGGTDAKISNERSRMKLIDWSPDARSIVFTSDRSGFIDLWRMEVTDGKPHGEAELMMAQFGDMTPLGMTQKGSIFGLILRLKRDISMASVDLIRGEVASSPVRLNSNHIGSSALPAWSPNGEYIAFLAATSPTEGMNYSTLSIRSESDGRQREFILGAYIGGSYHIAWSPDGNFVFGTTGNYDHSKLMRVNVTTGEVNIVSEVQQGSILCWSQDGRTVFVRRQDPAAKDYLLLARQIQTGQEKEIYRASGSNGFGQLGKPLSPDGKRIALYKIVRPYTSDAPGLLIVSTDGGPAKEIPQNKNITNVYWAPDAKSIVYSLSSGESSETWELSLEGGAPRKLNNELGQIRSISFHPDGKRIAFASSGPSEYGIWAIENFHPLKSTGK